MKEPARLFTDFLARKNLKMTAQRRVIFDAFMKQGRHLTADELCGIVKRMDKSIGTATVYRMLRLLTESGIAGAVDFGDGATRYELRHGQRHHDHLICEQCGRSVEVVDNRIEKLQEKLAASHGFVLTGHAMYLYGLCRACRKKEGRIR